MRRAACVSVLAAALGAAAGCAPPLEQPDLVYQVSVVRALQEGVYDGALTIGELRARGDFGLGTFHALDGELVLLAGRCWQVRADGRAYPAADSARTPFAVVTFFQPDQSVPVGKVPSLAQLCAFVDSQLASLNRPYAVRIAGHFEYVRARSVPAQPRPYPPLAEALKHQRTFEFRDVRGTMVGFRLPPYVQGVNVPGYHLHFLTAGAPAGGHVLACRLQRGVVEIDACSALHVALPGGGEFLSADLSRQRGAELERIER